MTDNNDEMLELVLSLLEKSKQDSEITQKAIGALQNEQNALKSLKSDLNNNVAGLVREELKTALETQNKGYIAPIKYLSETAKQIEKTEKELNFKKIMAHYVGFTVFMVVVLVLFWQFVPTMDEIKERRTEISQLNDHIAHLENVKNLNATRCNGKTCVSVDVKQCYTSTKGEKFCIAKARN